MGTEVLLPQVYDILYLDKKYVLSHRKIPPIEDLFYTGQRFHDMKLYVARGDIKQHVPLNDKSNEIYRDTLRQNKNAMVKSNSLIGKHVGIPDVIYMKRSDGSVVSYNFKGIPTYAYTCYGSYNINEPVDLGIASYGGEHQMPNTAPWTIALYTGEGERGKIIASGMGLQMITPLFESEYWTWDQRTNDGEMAQFGEYVVNIMRKYKTSFKIDPKTPSVIDSKINYPIKGSRGEPDIDRFMNVPQLGASGNAYNKPGSEMPVWEDIVSEMQFKAMAKGLDPNKLKAAIDTIPLNSRSPDFPVLAEHANYGGKPSWIIVLNIKVAGIYGHVHFFVIDDSTNKIVYENGCK